MSKWIWFIGICWCCWFVIIWGENQQRHHGQQNVSSCVWKPSYGHTFPEVYFINLASSIERKKLTQEHLQALHVPKIHRINALTMKNIHIPEQVKVYRPFSLKDNEIKRISKPVDSRIPFEISHILTAFSMRRKNPYEHIPVTASHLEAIRKAIFENTTDNPYALILEDDVFFPFNLNITKLIDSAPKDFVFLQLFNSEMASLTRSFELLYKNNHNLWTIKDPDSKLSYWGACAYIIHRERLRPIISQVIYRPTKPQYSFFHFKMLSGHHDPCGPLLSECCQYNETTKKYMFTNLLPCVNSPRGFYADSFIFALAKTYVITIPIITNHNISSAVSTIHQDHVINYHLHAFEYHHQLINSMIQQIIPKPLFVDIACLSIP